MQPLPSCSGCPLGGLSDVPLFLIRETFSACPQSGCRKLSRFIFR